MEKKQVLLVGLGNEDCLVREALKDQDIQVLSADAAHLDRTVGSAFTDALPQVSGEAMDPMLIMFRNFTQNQLDPVLRAVREAGLSRQPLKAMVTQTNWSWNLRELYAELQQEQKVMGALIRLKKLRDSMPMPDFMNIPAMQARIRAEVLLKGGEDATVEAVEAAIAELRRFA